LLLFSPVRQSTQTGFPKFFHHKHMKTLHFIALFTLIGFVGVGAASPPSNPDSQEVSSPAGSPARVSPQVPKQVGSSPAEQGHGRAAQPAAPVHDFARWEKEIAAYESSDRTSAPPKGGALFIGSSTVRLWKTLPQDFLDHKVINRGFGGSEIVDATHFADRIIFPYEPRQIFLRSGGNDIHGGRLPAQVAADFADFVRVVRERLPNTEIIYIAVNPAPARWGENDKYRALNNIIRKMAVEMPRVSFIDAYDISLTTDGRGRPELFVADRLHFNAQGYKLLAERVRPYLTPVR
jgi:lysophospholipase L1-like esterase